VVSKSSTVFTLNRATLKEPLFVRPKPPTREIPPDLPPDITAPRDEEVLIGRVDEMRWDEVNWR
jgi:hypothetical protein